MAKNNLYPKYNVDMRLTCGFIKYVLQPSEEPLSPAHGLLIDMQNGCCVNTNVALRNVILKIVECVIFYDALYIYNDEREIARSCLIFRATDRQINSSGTWGQTTPVQHWLDRIVASHPSNSKKTRTYFVDYTGKILTIDFCGLPDV